MSTKKNHNSLNNNDLQKREISNRVLSPIQDTIGRPSSQNRPERGPLIPFEAKKGPFSDCSTQGPFSAVRVELSTKARERPSVPLSLAGPAPDRPSWPALGPAAEA